MIVPIIAAFGIVHVLTRKLESLNINIDNTIHDTNQGKGSVLFSIPTNCFFFMSSHYVRRVIKLINGLVCFVYSIENIFILIQINMACSKNYHL